MCGPCDGGCIDYEIAEDAAGEAAYNASLAGEAEAEAANQAMAEEATP